MKEQKFDRQYLRMAFIWSENSYAIRRQVGCLIVKDNSIISDGYNGTPSGFPNICEHPSGYDDILEHEVLEEMYDSGEDDLVTFPYVLHAESNAIAKLAKSSNSSLGATIYITDEPCLECSKMIIQSGIRRVVYGRAYWKHDGVNLLKKANIEVKQINIQENEKSSSNEETK